MRAVVDESCVACGLCPEICPEVFKLEGAIAEVIVDVVPPQLEAKAREAAEQCPTEAIKLTD